MSRQLPVAGRGGRCRAWVAGRGWVAAAAVFRKLCSAALTTPPGPPCAPPPPGRTCRRYCGYRYGHLDGRILQCLLYKRAAPGGVVRQDDNFYAHPLDTIVHYDFHTDT